MRREYETGELSEADAGSDPFELFDAWMSRATQAGLVEPTAAALATCEGGRPSCRMVLVKGADRRGFAVYTNFESRKAHELERTGRAALTLWWDRLERQVRIEGTVERVSDAEADAYHASRPRPSQVAAWASEQSRTIASRAEL